MLSIKHVSGNSAARGTYFALQVEPRRYSRLQYSGKPASVGTISSCSLRSNHSFGENLPAVEASKQASTQTIKPSYWPEPYIKPKWLHIFAFCYIAMIRCMHSDTTLYVCASCRATIAGMLKATFRLHFFSSSFSSCIWLECFMAQVLQARRFG